MKLIRRFASAPVLAATACAALATPIASAQPITVATVPVGNTANLPDADNGFGAVGYEYNIAKYDVTVSQYCSFLNSVAVADPYGIYHPNMAQTDNGNPGIVRSGEAGGYSYSATSGRENHPITDVSFWNSTRFANWLDNGQPVAPEGAGSTETGAYNLIATAMDVDLVNTPANKNLLTTSQRDNDSIVRDPSANWAITSENEWYKAAYYAPNRVPSGASGLYYDYPTQSDSMIQSQANTYSSDTSPVGAYPYPTYYGTYDQGGNVYQWNETITNGYNVRGERGGSFKIGGDLGRLASFESSFQQPWITDSSWGFRVVQLNTVSTGGLLDLADRSLVLSRQPASALIALQQQLSTGYNQGAMEWHHRHHQLGSCRRFDTSHCRRADHQRYRCQHGPQHRTATVHIT